MSEKLKQNQKLRIAKIVSVHGVRGLVKIQVFLENPFDLIKLGALKSRDGDKIYDVDIRGQSKGTLLCAIKGVTDRDSATAMRGVELFVDRTALPDVEDAEEFYVADLIGMDIRLAATNKIIGRVRSVQDHGAGDIIVINYKEAGKSDEMFSFTHSIFPNIDLEQRYLSFVPPDETAEQNTKT